MARLFSALLLAAGLLTAHTCSTKDAAAPALPAVSDAITGAQGMPAVTTATTGSFAGTIDQAPASCTSPSPSPTWGPRRDTRAPEPVFLSFPFNNAASPSFESPIAGTTILSPAQAAALLASGVYANLHTAAQPSGEIRANLTVK